jgi:hypothetical protein
VADDKPQLQTIESLGQQVAMGALIGAHRTVERLRQTSPDVVIDQVASVVERELPEVGLGILEGLLGLDDD